MNDLLVNFVQEFSFPLSPSCCAVFDALVTSSLLCSPDVMLPVFRFIESPLRYSKDARACARAGTCVHSRAREHCIQSGLPAAFAAADGKQAMQVQEGNYATSDPEREREKITRASSCQGEVRMREE